MAQFYCGMEESPWTGWTLSGIAQCGPRLFLSGGYADEMDAASLASWTQSTGSMSIQSGRWKFSGSQYYNFKLTAAASGNYDFRVDYDVPWQAASGGAYVRFIQSVGVAGADYVGIRYYGANNTLRLMYKAADVASLACPANIRFGSLRITRVANLFTGYYLDPFENAWVTIGSTTQALSTTGYDLEVLNENTGTSYFGYLDNLRNVVPTVTSGTATSPVMDTEDGFRGVGWFVQPDLGTGTVLMECRTGPDATACSAASYQTATAWNPVTPTNANRFVQIRLTISGGSTTAASPEVGPILVNGSLGLANARLLFQRGVSALCRHTDATYQMSVMEPASSATALWGRAMLGVGRWVNANGRNMTFEGTTWDLGTYGVQGGDATVTAFAGNGQLQAEAAYTLLPGLYAGWSVFGSIISSAQKTAWTTAINAQIGVVNAINWNAFAISNRVAFTAIANLGAVVSGQWTKTGTTLYVDADSSTNLTNLAGGYVGQGFWNDSLTGDLHNDDDYANAISVQLALVLGLKPTYTDAATIKDWMQQTDRSFRAICNPDGLYCMHGRSVIGSNWVDGAELTALVAEQASGSFPLAREMASTAVWGMLRFNWFMGHDFSASTVTRAGSTGSLEGYISPSLNACQVVTDLGIFATSSSIYSSFPVAYDGETTGASVVTGPAVAVCFGGGPNDPQLQSHASCFDKANGYASKYAARVMADRYYQNTGLLNTNAPNPQGAGFYYHDNSLSSGNNCSLQATTSYYAHHLGQAAVTWRTGSPGEYSATVNGTAVSGATMTEIVYLRGHHAVVFTKAVFTAGHTCVNMGYAAPPIPLRTFDVLANASTTTTYAYAEGPAGASGSLARVAQITALTSNLQGSGLPRTGTDFVSTGTQFNRAAHYGESVDLFRTASLTGTNYFACDMSFSRGAMTPATEAAYVGSYSQVGDVVTFDFDPNGVVALEKVYLAFTAQNLSGQSVGNYSITGAAVRCFSGKNSACDWFGGSDLTSISFNGSTAVTLGAAGNVSVYKADNATTRVWADQGDVTLYAQVLPNAFATVYAYRWDGVLIDVTASCTIGATVAIPAAVVTAYKYGLAKFDVVSTTGRATVGNLGPGGVRVWQSPVGGWQ